MLDISEITLLHCSGNAKLHMEQVDESTLNRISTPFCQLLWLHIGINPNSLQYGDMLGGFLYKPENRIFSFRFHIHRPNQKYASLSNKMTVLEEIVERIYHIDDKDISWWISIPTSFGHRAFWLYTPMSKLENNDDKHLRHLMTNITKYSREMDLCKKLLDILPRLKPWDSLNSHTGSPFSKGSDIAVVFRIQTYGLSHVVWYLPGLWSDAGPHRILMLKTETLFHGNP